MFHTTCTAFKQSSKQHIHVQSDFVLFTPSLLEAPLTDSDNMESLQHKNTAAGAEFGSSYDAISFKPVLIWLGFGLQWQHGVKSRGAGATFGSNYEADSFKTKIYMLRLFAGSDNIESLQPKNRVAGIAFNSNYESDSFKPVLIWLGCGWQWQHWVVAV